ncbi:MAG: hypothetical protein ACJ8G1_25325 [Vitreoscilla sp.]
MTSSKMSRASAAMLACALAGCGGGGGSSNPADGVQVTLDHSAISSIAVDDSPWTTDIVNIGISGGSGEYFVAAASDGDGFELELDVLSDTQARATARAIPGLPAGMSHTGHFTYKLCTDSACSHVAWSRTLPYTITRYRVDTTPVAMAGTEGVAATPMTLAVVPADTAHQLTFTSSDTSFLTTDHTDPAKLVLGFPTLHASAGVLSANVAIGTTPANQPTTLLAQLPVAITVHSDLIAPAIAPIVVTAGTTVQDLGGTAAVSFLIPQSRTWSASSDKPWLVLDAASGTGAGTIQYHVDTAKLQGIANWTDDVATLSIASPGLSTVSVPVTLSLHLPELSVVTPGAVLAGQASSIRVTGRGLSQVPSLTSATVGGVHATGGSILSDTAATLQLPALPAGATHVSVPNALSLATAAAPFDVEAPGTFATAAVPGSGMNRSIAYDATRHAIYATNMGVDQYAGTGSLVRYQLVGATWQVTTLPVAGVGFLALAPDRGTVYVASSTGLLAVDPDTMQLRSTIAFPDQSSASPGFYFDQPMPVTSDQRLWLTSYFYGLLSYYDLRTGSFGTASVPSAPDDPWGMYEPNVSAPAGGDNLFVASCTCASPTGPSYWYDATSAQFQHSPAMPKLNQASFDAAGTLMLQDSFALYRTDTWSLVGHPTITNGNQGFTGYGGILSSDGRRLYREVAAGSYSTSAIDHIEVFDTHATVPGTTDLVSLGTIALPNKATSCIATQAYFCDASGRLATDPAGTTLFWVGEQGLVVVPIPSAISGISSAPRAHAAATGRLAGRAAADVRR